MSNSRIAERRSKRESEKTIKRARSQKDGQKISTKRPPVLPRQEHGIKADNVQFQHPLKFIEVF